jgi:hypothetical protein
MRRISSLVVGAWAALLAENALAALIEFTTTDLGGGRWRYDYVVGNDGATAIDELTIYFDLALYANLAVSGAPPAWDAIVVQPDADIPDDGFFDALALEQGIAASGSLAGFSASFDWLGSGEPGGQRFDIVDPQDFSTLASGTTTNLVPGPAGAVLAATSVIALLPRWRRRSRARRRA